VRPVHGVPGWRSASPAPGAEAGRSRGPFSKRTGRKAQPPSATRLSRRGCQRARAVNVISRHWPASIGRARPLGGKRSESEWRGSSPNSPQAPLATMPERQSAALADKEKATAPAH
jgi:hypothetical protein